MIHIVPVVQENKPTTDSVGDISFVLLLRITLTEFIYYWDVAVLVDAKTMIDAVNRRGSFSNDLTVAVDLG